MRLNRFGLLIVLSTLAASCGGGGGSSGYSTAPTTNNGGNGAPSTGTTGTAANAVVIEIGDYSFSPGNLTVKAGTTVRWTDMGVYPHTATSDTNAWDSGSISAASTSTDPYGYTTTSSGMSYERVFTTPGTYKYHCALHPPSQYPSFVGTITVTP
jgi:plastocyanin